MLEKGCTPDWARRIGTAWLPDREVVFDYSSSSWGNTGALDLKERVGTATPGVLYEMTPDGWKWLDGKEGAPDRYRREHVHVLDGDGHEVKAQAYVVTDRCRQGHVPPAPEYLATVCAGLESNGLPTPAVRAAAEDERPHPYPAGVFVYGTLLRLEERHPAIVRHQPACVLLAEAPGRLLDLGGFPALVRGHGDEWVRGEFIRCERHEELVAALDQIEGFLGFGVEGSLYRRVMIEVHVGGGRKRVAWTYVYVDDVAVAQPIESGDWRAARGRAEAFLEQLVHAHAGGDETALVRRIGENGPFPVKSMASWLREHLPLLESLHRGALSERHLAQVSGIWTALSHLGDGAR